MESPVVELKVVCWLVGVYVAVVVGTVFALAVMSAAAPDLVNDEAWGHAVIVVVFAVLLPLRLHAARKGRTGAQRAVPIIAAVLLVVNAVEAALPGFVPAWMRVEMVGIAVLMLATASVAVRGLRR